MTFEQLVQGITTEISRERTRTCEDLAKTAREAGRGEVAALFQRAQADEFNSLEDRLLRARIIRILRCARKLGVAIPTEE